MPKIGIGINIGSSGSHLTPQTPTDSIITEDGFTFVTEDNNYIIQE